MPPGIPYIIANEAAERFSFYGMKAALAVFLVNYLGVLGGENLTEAQSTSQVSWFTSAVYFTPIIGAVLADLFFGKYRIIMTLSIVYCLGHLALAFAGIGGMVQLWLISGLGLIAIGAGGIKPCVSAHVGDQFGPKNQHLLTNVFNLFYFSINTGAVVSNLAVPWILHHYGPHWAFGIPGVLMALATMFFWLGRHKFIHVQADPTSFKSELFSNKGLRTVAKLVPLYLFVAVFWCLFDQTATTLVFQAEKMDRSFFGLDPILPSQIQAANPFLILVLIPVFSVLIYPKVNKLLPFTPLRKIGTGLFLMVVSFAVIAWAQEAIDRGETPHVAWQLLAYLIFTSAEILISIVCLEFSYTQAMPRMKSFIMGLFLLSVFVGNAVTALLNSYIQIPQTELGTPPTALVQSVEKVTTFYRNFSKFPETGALSLPDGVRLQLLHAKKVRLSLAGPDGELRTKDDPTALLTLPKGDEIDETSWLFREKKRLGMLEDAPASPDAIPQPKVSYQTGGGLTLEGAAYFWFLTKLMLATAVLFIPYALLYKEETHLQQ